MGARGKLPKSNLSQSVEVNEAKPDKDNEALRERRWKAESALETLQRAEEHKKDKGLMKDIKNLAKEKMNGLKKMCE